LKGVTVRWYWGGGEGRVDRMRVKVLRGTRSRIGEVMMVSMSGDDWRESRRDQGEGGTVLSIGLLGMEMMLELRRWVVVFVRWEAVRIRRLGKEGVRGVVGVVGELVVDIPLSEGLVSV
jgi:hypothetical protein